MGDNRTFKSLKMFLVPLVGHDYSYLLQHYTNTAISTLCAVIYFRDCCKCVMNRNIWMSWLQFFFALQPSVRPEDSRRQCADNLVSQHKQSHSSGVHYCWEGVFTKDPCGWDKNVVFLVTEPGGTNRFRRTWLQTDFIKHPRTISQDQQMKRRVSFSPLLSLSVFLRWLFPEKSPVCCDITARPMERGPSGPHRPWHARTRTITPKSLQIPHRHGGNTFLVC